MAEPLAIIGAVKSIASIIDGLSKSISTLRELRSQWKDADFNVLNLSTQLTALRTALTKIKEWTESDLGVPHHQLIIDLDDSVACCRTIVEKIDASLSELQKKPNGELQVSAKIKAMIGSKSMDDLQRTLELQTNALTLLLTACSCKTISEQKALLERSSTRKTLRRAKNDSASLIVHRDTTSLLSHYTDNLSELSMIFNFDAELLGSKVYERAVRGPMKAALRRRHSEAKLDASSIDTKRNEEIEKLIRADKLRQRKEINVLLMGTNDEDTSNFMKMVKPSFTGGFSVHDRKLWRVHIFYNLVNAFQVVLADMDEKEVEFSNDESFKWAELLLSDPDIGPDDPLPYDFLQAFMSLWEDKGTQLAMARTNRRALRDNLSYFFEDIDRLFLPNYVPKDQDILRTRLRTTGINETVFDLGSLRCRISDIGGQKPGRTKWMHLFANTPLIIFQAMISSYDETTIEDRTVNRMIESLMLFEHITNSSYFKRSDILLLFTQMERFREKISSGHSPIHRHFPDYQGSPSDIEAAKNFFAEKFSRCIRCPDPHMELSVRYVNSMDMDVVREIVMLVQTMIHGHIVRSHIFF